MAALGPDGQAAARGRRHSERGAVREMATPDGDARRRMVPESFGPAERVFGGDPPSTGLRATACQASPFPRVVDEHAGDEDGCETDAVRSSTGRRVGSPRVEQCSEYGDHAGEGERGESADPPGGL